jgi:hypothetical protein
LKVGMRCKRLLKPCCSNYEVLKKLVQIAQRILWVIEKKELLAAVAESVPIVRIGLYGKHAAGRHIVGAHVGKRIYKSGNAGIVRKNGRCLMFVIKAFLPSM